MQKIIASPLFNISVFSLFWALQIFVSKIGFLKGAEIFTFTVQSVILTTMILSLIVLPRKFHLLKKLPRRIILSLFLVNILGGLGGLLSNAGVKFTTAANAGFLFQIDIALTIIFAWMLLHEKLTRTKITMLLLILTGTFFLTTNGKLIIPHIGDILIILASSCFAINTILVRKLFKQTIIDPDIASFIRSLASLSLLMSIMLSNPLYPTPIKEIFTVHLFHMQQITYVFLNSIFIVVTLLFLNKTLQTASASYTAMMASVTPILVAILALTFLKETMTIIQLFGAFLIISASFVTHKTKIHQH
jgi:drug/metabolite transporter (DMT)-like permease